MFTGFFYIIWGIYLSIDFSSKLKKISNYDSKLLENELNDERTIYYNVPKIFLTPNYIIIFNSKVRYYRYSDIKSINVIYTKSFRSNFTAHNIALKLINGKRVFLYSSLAKSTILPVQYEFIDKIIEKNPNIEFKDNK